MSALLYMAKTQRTRGQKFWFLGEATWHKTMQIMIPRHFVKEDIFDTLKDGNDCKYKIYNTTIKLQHLS